MSGLTVGSTGKVGVAGPSLMTSADMRSFSEKAFSGSPILTLASWALKKEWISNGRDRCILPGRNRMKDRLCIYDESDESIEKR